MGRGVVGTRRNQHVSPRLGHTCDAGPPQENTSSGIRPAPVSRESWVREPLWAFYVRRAGDGPQLGPRLAGVVTVAPAETTFRQLSLVQSHIQSQICRTQGPCS